MIDDRDRHEFGQLVDRLEHGSVARDDWANLAALALLAQPDVVLVAIAADGFDAFVRIATPIYRGHAFQYADYRRIFDRVCDAAAHAHTPSA